MVCIYCGAGLDVKNSRLQQRSNQVWRRRECPDCGSLFTTHEKIDLSNTLVVKTKKNKLTPFNRDKLLLSLYRSCGHREKSVADAAGITETVISRLSKQSSNGMILNTKIIAECIIVLQNFDKAAVVQYQAYHPSK